MMNFCTLFDSNYLDKGLCLYNSLLRVSEDFNLYIFCFDNKSENILKNMELKHVIVLNEKCLESTELLNAKEGRSRAEYCWTCTPLTIEYVLDNYDVDDCTYIDADLYFYSDPKILFDEIRESGANIAIAPHRFPNTIKAKRTEYKYGKYCVQFNYFDKSENGKKALKWWKKQCLDWCYCKVKPGKYGDQKYLDEFCNLFPNVHEMKHLGCGVAPWNLSQYEVIENTEKKIILEETSTSKSFEVVFYHFQHIRFIENAKLNMCSGTKSYRTKQAIYFPYIKETLAIRELLKKHNVHFSNAVVHASSPIRAFYQKYIRRFIKQNIKSDIVDLRQFEEYQP